MTLFERIIIGEIPSHKVYEDNAHIAILTIEPVNKGHVLVIPKHPYRNILNMPESASSALFALVSKIAKAVSTATNADGINISMNNEAAAGQEVFHAHVHIIPRYTNDGSMPPVSHVSYSNNEASLIADAISKSLISR